MLSRWTRLLPMALCLATALLPPPAAAQGSAGPMTVQRIGNSAFIAPDFKITDFDGKTSGVAGAFGGYLFENTFFIGAGGYGLTDTSSRRDMWYFGLVTGVYINRDRPVGYGFKALIGGGEATYGQQYYGYWGAYRSGIFVFEPEANVVVQVNRHVALAGGVGYRFAGEPYWGYYGGYGGFSNGNLSGLTGTVSVQIGSGF